MVMFPGEGERCFGHLLLRQSEAESVGPQGKVRRARPVTVFVIGLIHVATLGQARQFWLASGRRTTKGTRDGTTGGAFCPWVQRRHPALVKSVAGAGGPARKLEEESDPMASGRHDG